MSNLKNLKAEIIKRVPEIKERNIGRYNDAMFVNVNINNITIRIEDVLKCLKDKLFFISVSGNKFCISEAGNSENKFLWEINVNLDNQSEDTINFLSSTICKQ